VKYPLWKMHVAKAKKKNLLKLSPLIKRCNTEGGHKEPQQGMHGNHTVPFQILA
jgi:hypothetical protein